MACWLCHWQLWCTLSNLDCRVYDCFKNCKKGGHTVIVALSPTTASNPEVTSPKTCAFAISKRSQIKARRRSDARGFLLVAASFAAFAFADRKRAQRIATSICPFARYKRTYSTSIYNLFKSKQILYRNANNEHYWHAYSILVSQKF